MVKGSLTSYDGCCTENVTLKWNVGLGEVFCDYYRLVTLYKTGQAYFRLLGTNGSHVKAKIERLTAAASRCRQKLKYETFTWSFGRLRQNNAPKSVSYVHDHFPRSTNQGIDLWRRRRCRRHFLISLVRAMRTLTATKKVCIF